MILYLTSSPVGSYRAGAPSYRGFNPENDLVRNLMADWKNEARCLIISANPDAYMENNEARFFFEKAVKESGLPVSVFDLCDSRNAKEMVDNLSRRRACADTEYIFSQNRTHPGNERI